MEIRAVGAELFHSTGRQTGLNQQSLIAILRMRLKISTFIIAD
jgi:hypothetical protein